MSPLIQDLRRYLGQPRVRPWALAAPIVVLLIALPLLRPLRHPDPRQVSSDEAARLVTVQAIVEQGTLALDDVSGGAPARQTVRIGEHTYSDQPPVFAALLSATYWA